jgi:rRNA-processing protein FCF1
MGRIQSHSNRNPGTINLALATSDRPLREKVVAEGITVLA